MRRATLPVGAKIASSLFIGPLRYAHNEVSESSIIKLAKEHKIFSDASIEAVVSRFTKSLSDCSYSRHYTDEEVAAHVHGYLCAKAKSSAGESFEHFHEHGDSAFYICKTEHQTQLRAVRQLTKFVTREQDTKKSVSVRGYRTDDGNVLVFTAKIRPFVNPHPASGETNIAQLASEAFLEERSPELQERYQDLLTSLHGSVIPVLKTFDGADGEVRLSVAMTANRSYYLASLQAAIQEIQGAVVLRCFSETFSNDTHIYTFYVRGATGQQLINCASLASFLPSRPANSITRLHEDLVFNTEQAVFTDVAIIFAFYFAPKPTSDDYRYIRSVVAREPNGVSRLNNLRMTLSLEMMSERYIGNLISLYPQFMIEIYEDFRRGTTPESRSAIREKVAQRFKEDQRTDYDLDIFNTLLQFNEVAIKHNFFKEDKVALCFRLDPSFLKSLEYPRVPHGVFLLAGSNWRGFHIRFTDISRGGVRMIISRENMYRRNKRTVFQENYNLALTQLLKNKDIPEGGSKGTILVSSRYMNKFNRHLCQRFFLQYIDALLDVTLPGEQGVVDRLQESEILFLGPDENTAGTFPSAGSLFSKERGLTSWKSFTTGKESFHGWHPRTMCMA
ncbi:putative Bacterial NAD glutamate dehydrogenase [Trypanosoma vivax]|nr:putative Bacterial NAD glutamate dehydrogenase [Trypanosoma vivax]